MQAMHNECKIQHLIKKYPHCRRFSQFHSQIIFFFSTQDLTVYFPEAPLSLQPLLSAMQQPHGKALLPLGLSRAICHWISHLLYIPYQFCLASHFWLIFICQLKCNSYFKKRKQKSLRVGKKHTKKKQEKRLGQWPKVGWDFRCSARHNYLTAKKKEFGWQKYKRKTSKQANSAFCN